MHHKLAGMWPMLAASNGEQVSHHEQLTTFAKRYADLLATYLKSRDEELLLAAFRMGKEMVRSGIHLEEFAELHTSALAEISGDHEIGIHPYMEVMMAYGSAMRAMDERIRHDDQMRVNFASLKHALGDTIQAINSVRETNDNYTASHQQRVALLACEIAAKLGLEADRVEGLRMAASLHDVGMVQLPRSMLSKSGGLDSSEMQVLRAHPQVGYDLLKEIDLPWPVAEITRQHHERIDGSGYPFGLMGDEILVEAKIISVADTVEAMVSHRPYRAPLDISLALSEIQAGRGTIFDAEVVDVCCNLFTDQGFSFIH